MQVNFNLFLSDVIEPSNGRMFPFDVFISHNHRDGSELVKAGLEECGVNVWLDESDGSESQRTAQTINRAALNSRFILLFVAEGYRDSEWCRAEYLTAIKAESDTGARRVVVLEAGKGADVPEELEFAKRFAWPADLTRLSDYLLEGNAIARPPRVSEVSISRQGDEVARLQEVAEREVNENSAFEDPDSAEVLFARLAVHAIAGGVFMVEQLCPVYRDLDPEIVSQWPTSVLWSLESACRFLLTSESDLNRYFGAQLATQALYSNELRQLLAYVSINDSDPACRATATAALLSTFDDLSSAEVAIVQRSVSQLGYYLLSHAVVTADTIQTLPDGVKLRLLLESGVDVDLLSGKEVLALARRRIDRLVARSDEPEFRSDVLLARFGVPDIEVVLRSLAELVRDSDAESIEIASAYSSIFDSSYRLFGRVDGYVVTDVILPSLKSLMRRGIDAPAGNLLFDELFEGLGRVPHLSSLVKHRRALVAGGGFLELMDVLKQTKPPIRSG